MHAAIVLAAGLSRRMGTQKMLLPFGDTTVIGRVVDQLLRSTVDEIYVVVGHEAARVAEELAARPVHLVINPDYRAGMLSSVRCGIEALPPACEAVMVVLGDQPSITAELVDAMLRAFAATDQGILVPVFNGRRGHPLLVAASYREEILSHYDDLGLRGLLQAHPDDVCPFSVSTSQVLLDMDYPEDYRRLCEQERGRETTPRGRDG